MTLHIMKMHKRDIIKNSDIQKRIVYKKIIKVSKFMNEFMKSSLIPKYEQNIIRISALCSEGRNLDHLLVVFWEK